MNTDKFNRFFGALTSTHTNGKKFSTPSNFFDYLRSNGVNNSYNTYYICRMTDDYILYLSTDTNTWANINHVRAFYIDEDYNYFYDDFTINGNTLATDMRTMIQNNCFNIFYSDFSIGGNVSYFNNYNTSYYDDFLNSKHPTDYFVGMLYFAIPILLFVIGLKVVRKGLFK